MQVLSCMPLASAQSGNDNITYHFEETPSIPSYLLAFAIGNFAPVEQEQFTSTLNLENYIQQMQINVSETSNFPFTYNTRAKMKSISKICQLSHLLRKCQFEYLYLKAMSKSK
jgi:hypothetical protein